MTSGTPESTQNWVLAGFQNSLDLASMSPLEAKAMSSSATITSRAAAGHFAHPRPAAKHVRTPSVWFNQTNTGCDRLVSTGPCYRHISGTRKPCHGFYQVILSAL